MLDGCRVRGLPLLGRRPAHVQRHHAGASHRRGILGCGATGAACVTLRHCGADVVRERHPSAQLATFAHLRILGCRRRRGRVALGSDGRAQPRLGVSVFVLQPRFLAADLIGERVTLQSADLIETLPDLAGADRQFLRICHIVSSVIGCLVHLYHRKRYAQYCLRTPL